MTTFCDVCGDIVVACIPVEVTFYKRGKITLNICIECWNRDFKDKSRKLQVVKMLEVLKE